MTDITTLSPAECDALAKGLRDAADAAAGKRKSVDAGSPEYDELQRHEDALRDLADQATALAIERDTVLPDLSAAHLQAAIDEANGTMAGIRNVRSAIGVLTGLVAFATAVISRKPKAIWDAARALKGRLDAAA
jgi:hypothetical protein